jgi:hypothetical protein
METINKLGAFSNNLTVWADKTDRCLRTGANTHCITSAEEKHLAEQADGVREADGTSHAASLDGDAKTRISLVAG